MNEPKITRLPKSEVKIEFTVTPEEAKPYIEEAVRDLSTAKPIPGFRPGKATYEDAKRAYGEMKIWETALERIVRAHYVKTVLGEKLETVGSPSVNVDQLTPGQDIRFTTISPTAPEVTKFPDFTACKVETKKMDATDEDVTKAVEEMRRMRRTETLVERAATVDDLVLIDLDIHKDRVALEGGGARNYRVYLNEAHYIPGFAEQLIGSTAGEERTFKLKFPEEHFQKHLAGQEVDFTAKIKGVHELTLPPVDDAFAQGVGLKTMEELKGKLRENLQAEHDQRSREAAEIELLDKLVDQSAFSEVPDILLNEEIRRMVHELQHGVEEQGMEWSAYLASLKKTSDELKLEFVPQALRRIRTAVLIKNISKKENIAVTDEELDQEVDRILSRVPENDTETRERVSSPDYRDYVAVQLRNRKTLEWLRKECMK